jgi:DNA-binding NtrC family response regulator
MDNHIKNKLHILNNLNQCDERDLETFKRKVELLKEIALLLLEEIEALNYVRSVNISRGINLPEELRTFEIHLIQSALERTGGHQTQAARLLGINLTTLHNKLKRLNINPDIQAAAPVLHEDTQRETAGRLDTQREPNREQQTAVSDSLKVFSLTPNL